VKILVADDEAGFRELLSEILKLKGHKVDVAGDGQKASELIQAHHYDIAFLDLSMPERTGLELAEEVKKKDPGTTTALVTAYLLVEDEFVKAAGVDEYISKPFRIRQIEAILDRHNLRSGKK